MSHKELEQFSEVLFVAAKIVLGLSVAAKVIDEALEEYEKKTKVHGKMPGV